MSGNRDFILRDIEREGGQVSLEMEFYIGRYREREGGQESLEYRFLLGDI